MDTHRHTFTHLKTKDLGDSSHSLNLGCIEVIEYSDQLVIIAEPEFTGINHIITFDKKAEFGLVKNFTNDSSIKKQIPFSMFLGILELAGGTFFLFVHEVKAVPLERHLAFEVQSIVAYDIDGFLPDFVVSDYFTFLFHQTAYFSYSVDMTNGDDYFDICNVNPRKVAPNFFFMSNLNAIQRFVEVNIRGWMVPLFFGKLTKVAFGHSTMYLIYKKSLLDQAERLKEDINLLSNFYCPSSMKTLDIILVQNGEVKFVARSIANNFPGVFGKSEKRPNVYEGLNYNSNRVHRYYQFFNEYFQCSSFFVQGSESLCELMRKGGRCLEPKSETAEAVSISHLAILSSKEDLMEAVEKYLANTCVNFQGKRASCPSFLSFSICTEGNFYGLQRIAMLIYDFFLSTTKAPIVEGYCWNLIGQNKSDNSSFVDRLKLFFHSIAMREESMEDIRQKPLWRTKLSAFGQFSAIIDEFYGHRKMVSKFFERIIRARSLNVFSEHQIQLCLITHNCGGRIPKDPNDFGYAQRPDVLQSDLVILCLQEIIEMTYHNFKSIFLKHDEQAEQSWVKFMAILLPDFKCIGNVSLAGLMIITLANKKCKAFLELSLENQKIDKMGFLSLLANKGYIFLDLKVNYERIKVSNNHFKAGNSDKDQNTRMEQIRTVVDVYEAKQYSNVGFICGDMNFRLNVSPLIVEDLLTDIKGQTEIPQSRLDALLKHDRLSQMLAPTGELKNVYEFPIRFLPTYKKLIGSRGYNSERQTPAWLSNKD
jgi:hypothetical protein